MKLFYAKMKICTVCETGLFTEEEEQNWGFGNFTCVIVTVYFTAYVSKTYSFRVQEF